MASVEEIIGLASLDPQTKFTDPGVSKLLDEHDSLKQFREEFEIPTNKGIGATEVSDDLQDGPCTYFVGNSLGPVCKRSRKLLNEEMDVWSRIGVQGHFKHPLDREWMRIAGKASKLMAPLVGGKEEEVACMGTLTANLHILMTNFYKPTKERFKILCEHRPFPSDEYAFASQVAMHGFNPEDAVIHVMPREGEHYLRDEDILAAITEHGSSIAIVLFSGVQYYTAQRFPIEKITKAAHYVGALAGWDLAHAVGNVPVQLHNWDVDFAAWCTYKYLNSGPGGIAGLFIHEKWQNETYLAGWWGHDEATRFEMPPKFHAIPGAQGYQQSNPGALAVATLLGSLQVFEEAGGIEPIRAKSVRATAYFEALLKASRFYVPPTDALPKIEAAKAAFTIITPEDPEARGAQISLLFSTKNMPIVFDAMEKRGVIGDERHPGIIRYAPVPLYCTFEDCRRTVELLEQVLEYLQA